MRSRIRKSLSDSQILDAGTLGRWTPVYRSDRNSGLKNGSLGLRPGTPPGGCTPGTPAPVPCLTADTQGSY